MAVKIKLTEEQQKVRAQQAALSAVEHGQYNMMIPIKDASHVWLKPPTSSKTRHLSTSSQEFIDVMLELANEGFEKRILVELESFIFIDPQWESVKDRVQESFKKV